MPLTDAHGRTISYLRLAVTDRCNLRCFYCMPEEGIDYVPRKDLLTYEELERLCRTASSLGVSKLRITGGEPFVRRDLMGFLQRISDQKLFRELHITTNGVLTAAYLPDLKRMGISGINLSLDTLDRDRFMQITHRNKLDEVLHTMQLILEHQIPLKINMVVMKGRNTEDMGPMIELTRNAKVEIRFIEEMSFNGTGESHTGQFMSYRDIEAYVRQLYPKVLVSEQADGETARKMQIPGYKGSLGIIAAYSRTFCGTCNRIRITPLGDLKTCLYDQRGFRFRDILRSGVTEGGLKTMFEKAVQRKYKNGHEAERDRIGLVSSESMATIGG